VTVYVFRYEFDLGKNSTIVHKYEGGAYFEVTQDGRLHIHTTPTGAEIASYPMQQWNHVSTVEPEFRELYWEDRIKGVTQRRQEVEAPTVSNSIKAINEEYDKEQAQRSASEEEIEEIEEAPNLATLASKERAYSRMPESADRPVDLFKPNS
jgi:hypothetical protein